MLHMQYKDKDNMLPDISIKVAVGPREFFDRLEQVAKRFDKMRIKRISDVAGYENWESLNLEPRYSSLHKKLCGTIIFNPESESRVFIEMSAKRWHPDPPSYDTYVESARILIAPLIDAYNNEYHSRCQLHIQAKTMKEPVLPAETNKRLMSFIVCANKSALHPYDWARFYKLISFCHSHRVKLSEGRLRHILIKEGFDSEKAAYLADIYCHGRNILASRR